jgi:type II secretory pathway pseudopilin PulG
LVEVLIAATLLTLVVGATLGTMVNFNNQTRANQLQNDAQETARNALDQAARQLRNHGAGTPQSPVGILKAGPYDMVFQTVDETKPATSENARNVEWVRYCLDYSTLGDEKLWVQYDRWTTSGPPDEVPSTVSCPDSAWGNQRVLADNLFNRRGGADRPLFTPDSSDPESINRVGLTAYVNANRGGSANATLRETRLDTAVALRNQNIAPSAAFTLVVAGDGHLVLNGSASSDRNGDVLAYQWAYDGTPIPSSNQVTLDYNPPTGSGTHTVSLTVTDPGGESSSATQTVDLDSGSTE